MKGDKFAMAASADEDGEGRVRSSMSAGALNSQSVIKKVPLEDEFQAHISMEQVGEPHVAQKKWLFCLFIKSWTTSGRTFLVYLIWRGFFFIIIIIQRLPTFQ